MDSLGGLRPLDGASLPELLIADQIVVTYPTRRGLLRRGPANIVAVDHVSLGVNRGEALGLVGESGSGKTTLGLALIRLLRSSGSVRFEGHDLAGLGRSEMRPFRRRMQIIFQDPAGSLDPTMRVGSALTEPLKLHHIATGSELKARVSQLLQLV